MRDTLPTVFQPTILAQMQHACWIIVSANCDQKVEFYYSGQNWGLRLRMGLILRVTYFNLLPEDGAHRSICKIFHKGIFLPLPS